MSCGEWRRRWSCGRHALIPSPDALSSRTGTPDTVEEVIEHGIVVLAIFPATIRTSENGCSGATFFEMVEVNGKTIDATIRGIGITAQKIWSTMTVILETFNGRTYMVVG